MKMERTRNSDANLSRRDLLKAGAVGIGASAWMTGSAGRAKGDTVSRGAGGSEFDPDLVLLIDRIAHNPHLTSYQNTCSKGAFGVTTDCLLPDL